MVCRTRYYSCVYHYREACLSFAVKPGCIIAWGLCWSRTWDSPSLDAVVAEQVVRAKGNYGAGQISCDVTCNERFHVYSVVAKYSDQTVKLLPTLWSIIMPSRGMRWRNCFRNCIMNLTIAGSIPDGVTEIFHWHNPSGRTVDMGSTQPLTEVNTGNVFWG